VARITVEDDDGHKAVKWVPLETTSAAETKQELDKLVVERSKNRLRHIGRGPKLRDYLEQTYLPRLDTSGKKPDTLVTEKGHLNRWRDSIGNLYLDKIRPYHVTGHLQKLKQRGKANRTCNLALVVLVNHIPPLATAANQILSTFGVSVDCLRLRTDRGNVHNSGQRHGCSTYSPRLLHGQKSLF